MYNSIYKHYIFKQSTGKLWNFYNDERHGLCYSNLSKSKTWSEPVSIQKNFLPPLFIDMDFEDNFHILFQDKQGNIFYTFLDKNNISTHPVLQSKINSAYNKFLQLIAGKNTVNLFFILDHNNASILAHQTIKGSMVNTPKVIDNVFKNDHPYSIVADKSGNIYAFYHVSDGRYLQIGFKKYSPNQKAWGEFTPVTRFNGDSQFPKTIIDNKDIIHISYQRRNEKQFELVYQQKVPDRNLWTFETIIQSSSYSFNNSSLLYANGNLIVFWVRDDNIFFSMSNDFGASWSKSAKHNFFAGKQLVCFKYKSNNPYENEKIYANEIPGSYVNGYRFAFYEDNSDNQNISTDEIKTMIVEGLNMLRGSVEDLKDSDSSINESLTNLQASYRNLQKELTKVTVKISYFENEFNQIRNKISAIENKKCPKDHSKDLYINHSVSDRSAQSDKNLQETENSEDNIHIENSNSEQRSIPEEDTE
ncbi:MAG: FHA domain-containing protein [Bacillota bacterium]|nr:FHA domain-containing protein [Bacillota bacterium]